MPELSSSSVAPETRGDLRIGLAAEFKLFRHPKVILAVVVLIFVPALYVLIYVGSVWDPYGSMSRLPAALVNQDVAISRDGHELNLGRDVVATLEKNPPFHFVRYDTPKLAHDALEKGEIAFVLAIPPAFSRHAFEAGEPAKLQLEVAEGANFTAAVFGQRFASELAHTLNVKINRARWAALVGENTTDSTTSLASGLQALKAGSLKIKTGSETLHAGSMRLNTGLASAANGGAVLSNGSVPLAEAAKRIAEGMAQIKVAVASIQAKLPTDAQLQELASGSGSLARGASELHEGLTQLDQATARIEAGAKQLQDGGAKVPFVGHRLGDGAGQLRDGIATYGNGVHRAADGAARLDAGLTQLNQAVQPLATGLVQLNSGLATLSQQLPASEQLELFSSSAAKIRDGNQRLSTGLNELAVGSDQLERGAQQLAAGATQLAAGAAGAADKFAAAFDALSPDKLAAPIQTAVTITAPAGKNGPAFAPYFSALSLWVGAVMTSFVFYLRRLPDSMRHSSRVARWGAKIIPLLVIGLLQASVVLALLALVLRIPLAHPSALWATLLLGSITFVSCVVCLISWLGDAGRLLAVIFLILQLAASGGIYPIELSPAFYQAIHPYLPFTLLVKALRATMFSAFGGNAAGTAGELALTTLVVTLLGVGLARWRYIAKEDYRPAVDF